MKETPNIKDRILGYEIAIHGARKHIEDLEKQLLDTRESLENNIYSSVEEAKDFLWAYYEDKAANSSGDGECGLECYKQNFKVGDTVYTITFTVEYNRYDKRYYYVEYFKLGSIVVTETGEVIEGITPKTLY